MVGFAEGELQAEFIGKASVKIIYGEGGKALIKDFVQGRIEGRLPSAHSGSLAPACRSRQEAGALVLSQIIKPESSFAALFCIHRDFFCIFKERIAFQSET